MRARLRPGALRLHPSRVVRFLGNECPDPGLGPWSDSVPQVLYDAIHAGADPGGRHQVEDWKTKELGLDARSDIVTDRDGNAYAIPRQGRGDPQPLHIERIE